MAKDDPLNQARPAARALWLDRTNFEEARDNWFEFACKMGSTDVGYHDRHAWNVACAAYMAMHAYAWEGRTEPRP